MTTELDVRVSLKAAELWPSFPKALRQNGFGKFRFKKTKGPAGSNTMYWRPSKPMSLDEAEKFAVWLNSTGKFPEKGGELHRWRIRASVTDSKYILRGVRSKRYWDEQAELGY